MNTKTSLLLLAFCLGLQTAPFSAHASDLSWSQWRGPTRDGIIKEGAPWPASITKGKLSLSWRKEIAKGYPGPIVSENLVFTVETKGKNEIVRAFDRTSGEQKWGNQTGRLYVRPDRDRRLLATSTCENNA